MMATYTGTRRTFSRRFLLPAAAASLAVAAIAGAGVWRLTHSGTTKSTVTTTAQVQQGSQQRAIQPAAVPLDRLYSGPVLDNSLVLVGSDSQAADVQQGIDQADAIRVEMGLAPLNASVLVAAPGQADEAQQTASENAFLAANGLPPLADPGASYASIIQDENTLRSALGLAPLALVDLR